MIQTDRLVLRRLQPSDAQGFHEIVGDPEVMRHWYPGADADLEATCARIAGIDAHWQRHGLGDLGVEAADTGQLLGFAGLHYISDMPEVNLGYAFRQSAWGQGFGFEATSAVVRWGFCDLGLDQVVAVIAPENIPSQDLAQKCGMRLWKAFAWSEQPRIAYRLTREEYMASSSGSAD